MMNLKTLLSATKKASNQLRGSSLQARFDALSSIAAELERQSERILEANEKDCRNAHKLSAALQDRLMLNAERIASMAESVRQVRDLPEILGQKRHHYSSPRGFEVFKQRIPLGTLCMIYESRPNVVIEASSLALKSGNAIVLKGGKEAKETNSVLGDLVQKAIAPHLPKECVLVLDSSDRSIVGELLQSLEIDLMIPRGGPQLIERVYREACMPVVAHFQGLCHVYIDQSAGEEGISIALNSKAQRPGVCNSAETLLVHRDWFERLGEKLIQKLLEAKVELRVEKDVKEQFSTYSLNLAQESDWSEEYLENILSMKVVDDLQEAVRHIEQFGTHHTESIVSKDDSSIDFFVQSVDASCVMVNASTRFNDGGELGLGAELGISTSKFHAYGPMGLEELTAQRFLVVSSSASLRI